MSENKQDNLETNDKRHWWMCKKINRDALKWIIIGFAGFVVIILIFGAGVFVGGMKARFSYRWAENYHRNFGGPQAGFFGDWRKFPTPPGDFIESRGTFGEIIKINASDFVVKGQGDVEKVVLVAEKTIIEEGRKVVKINELKIGDNVVIIGSPNEQGQIEAKLIRLFDGEASSSIPR